MLRFERHCWIVGISCTTAITAIYHHPGIFILSLIYRSYAEQLRSYRDHCDSILKEVEKALDYLKELEKQHIFVSTKTGALHEACEQLLEDQVGCLNDWYSFNLVTLISELFVTLRNWCEFFQKLKLSIHFTCWLFFSVLVIYALCLAQLQFQFPTLQATKVKKKYANLFCCTHPGTTWLKGLSPYIA